jgi:hypothetical protein
MKSKSTDNLSDDFPLDSTDVVTLSGSKEEIVQQLMELLMTSPYPIRKRVQVGDESIILEEESEQK